MTYRDRKPAIGLSPRASNALYQALNNVMGFDPDREVTKEMVKEHFPTYSKLKFISGCGNQTAYEICIWAGIEHPPTCSHCGQFLP